jgi:Protein of unknown function (DUF1488)
MNITFEQRRLYVAPRKSVLFFALVGERRLRCYVQHAALLEPQSVPRDEAEAYKHYLSAYDQNRDLIQTAAKRLIEANALERDDAVIVSSVAIALEDATKLAPTA